MKPRPFEYYNESQIFQLLTNNEKDIKVLMDIAYESAFRTWMSKKKRTEIITFLYDATFKALERKEKEIKSLTEKLNERDHRIHDLEVTGRYLQNGTATFKDEILIEIKTLTEKLDEKDQGANEPEITNKYLQDGIATFKDEILKEIKTLTEKLDAKEQGVHDLKASWKDLQNNFNDLKDEILKEFQQKNEETNKEEGECGESKGLEKQPKVKQEEIIEKKGNGINDEFDIVGPKQTSGDIAKDNMDTKVDVISTSEDVDLENVDVVDILPKTEKVASPFPKSRDSMIDYPTNSIGDGLFQELIKKGTISLQDGNLINLQRLTEREYRSLVLNIAFNISSKVDPKDAFLYYFYWWTNHTDEPEATPDDIFKHLMQDAKSVSDNNPVMIIQPKIEFDSTEFFQLAKKGMQILDIRWFISQDIEDFKTLYSGLSTILENKHKLRSLLERILLQTPHSFEEFITHLCIREILPNGFETRLSDEKYHSLAKLLLPYEKFNESADRIEYVDVDHVEITEHEDDPDQLVGSLPIMPPSYEIKTKESSVSRGIYRPRNYWILNLVDGEIQINLELGLSETYTPEALSKILGFSIKEKEYQFYLYERLICVFRKMINGDYKTDWHFQETLTWDGEGNIPNAYVTNKENKFEVSDFIQMVPNMEEPSLWEKRSSTEWNLVKGNNITNKSGAILHPRSWEIIGDEIAETTMNFREAELLWYLFEGEATIKSRYEEQKTYRSNVRSFNWIILDQSPDWMLKSNMTVIQNKPKVVVYTLQDKLVSKDEVGIWIKSHYGSDSWFEYSEDLEIPIGLLDVRIEKDGVIAYDSFFNIGQLRVDTFNYTSTSATLGITNNKFETFIIKPSTELRINQNANNYHVELDTTSQIIPSFIQCSVGNQNQRKLQFHMISPISGLCIVDSNGNIVPQDQKLSYVRLKGYRILGRKDKTNLLNIRNSIRTDVIISKKLGHQATPLISFKDEILRLLYLADIMNIDNSVILELSDDTEEISISYKISGFTDTLNIDNVANNLVSIHGLDNNLKLLAVPLNCDLKDISPLYMTRQDKDFIIPKVPYSDEFIVISANEEGRQIMPRFVSNSSNYVGMDKQERVQKYHDEFNDSNLFNKRWRVLLSYFNICIKYNIPFSTFDQIRAISRSSKIAAKAFLFIGINQSDPEFYIQKHIPKLEKDLGICFHWIKKMDWSKAIEETSTYSERLYKNDYRSNLIAMLTAYFNFNDLEKVVQHVLNGNTTNVEPLRNVEIMDFRSQLGAKVLAELPRNKPIIFDNYGIPINNHKNISLLLHSPIAVAESIANIQQETSIWGGGEVRNEIRRNIQYSHYLDSKFYGRIILQVLQQKIKN